MNKLVIFLFVLLLGFPSIVHAESLVDDSLSISTASASSEQGSVDYTLPYPGLLPDNPLYIVKAMRDGVVGLLITNPEKKALFDILQADKRLAAGMSLIQKDSGKYALAETTFSKGENYMEEAIIKTKDAKRQGIVTDSLESSLYKSIQKHREVLTDMTETAPVKEKKAMQTLIKRVTQYEKDVHAIVAQPKKK